MTQNSNNVGLVQSAQEAGLSTEPSDAGQTMRIDMLGAEEGAPAIEAPARPKVPLYMIILVGLIVVSAAALYGMRKIGMSSGIGDDDGPQITYDVTKQVGNVTADHKRALAQLNGDHIAGQVPVENVQKNPFILDSMLPEQVEAPTTNPNARSPEEIAAEQLKKKILTTYKGLKVQALVGGSNPVARINDGLYRVGDRLGGVFEIMAIHGREVELKGDDGETYLIEMQTAMQSWGPTGN